MTRENPILVTGAAGNIGGVGVAIVKLLRQADLPVRALVHREDVARALTGCRRMYFGMSVSAVCLQSS